MNKIEDFLPVVEADFYKDKVGQINDLIQRDDVVNVGIIGPYGSGKSSLLKTYMAQSKYKTINISLAKYNYENSILDSNNDFNWSKELVERDNELEKGILQQIFYDYKNKKTGSSSIKKIKKINKLPYYILVPFVTLFTILILFNEFLNSRRVDWLDLIYNHQVYFGLILSVFLTCLVLTIIFDLFINKSLKFIRINEIELSFDVDKSVSLVDKFLTEIVYYFDNSKTRVVIFEDLDRFERISRLLMKLKEVNKIINSKYYSTKNIKDKIVFIFAISDDSIKEPELKVKFFDSIIPIRRFVNHESIKNELQNIVTGESKISSACTNELSYWVHDKRLLKLIKNDFYDFKRDNEDCDKSLVYAFYKNLVYEDYDQLLIGKSIINKLIKTKNEIIKEQKLEIENKIKEIESKVEKLQKEVVMNKSDLLTLLANEISIIDGKRGMTYVNSEYDFTNDNITYNCIINGYISTHSINSKRIPRFTEFRERYQRITESSENDYQEELNTLRSQLRTLNSLTLLEIAKENSIQLKNKLIDINQQNSKYRLNNEQIDFIFIMISKGYIAEDYGKFIFRINEGILSSEDNQFFNQITYEKQQKLLYEPVNVAEIIERLPISLFDTKYVLNFSLIYFIYSNKEKYQDRYKKITDQIFSSQQEFEQIFTNIIFEKEYSNTIIIDTYKSNEQTFINMISQIKDYDIKVKIIILILENHDLKSMKTIIAPILNQIKNINEYFNSFNDDQFKEILKDYDIKFDLIENVDSTKLETIIHLSAFIINEVNINKILRHINFDNTTDNKLYSEIERLDNKYLNFKTYINGNLELFISKVWLNKEGEYNEDEVSIVKLLNSKIDSKLLLNVIEKNNTIISNISNVETKYYQPLLDRNKIRPTLDNLYLLFKNNIDFSKIGYELTIEATDKDYELKSKDDYLSFVVWLINTKIIKVFDGELIDIDSVFTKSKNIKNDEFLLSALKVKIPAEIKFTPLIQNGLLESLGFYITSNPTFYIMKSKNVVDKGHLNYIIDNLTKSNATYENFVEFINNKKISIREEYDFSNKKFNETLKRYYIDNQENLDEILWYSTKSNDLEALGKSIKSGIYHDQIDTILFNLGTPYNQISDTEMKLDYSMIDINFLTILKNVKLIEMHKNNKTSSCRVKLIKN